MRFRIDAQFTQRRLGSATTAPTAILRLGEQFLRLIQINRENLIFRSERTRIRLAIGTSLRQIRTVTTIIGLHNNRLHFTGLSVRFLVRTNFTRQTQQTQRIIQRQRFRTHRLEQRRHLRAIGSLLSALALLRLAITSHVTVSTSIRRRHHQRNIRAETTITHFNSAPGNRIDTKCTRTAGMILNQIMTDFHRQLIRSESIRQRRTLRIALIIQMVRILQIRAIPADAHMQTVADLNRIDLASVDFTQLRDLLLQTGMRLVRRLRGTLTGTEIEAGQPIPAGLLTARDLVKTAFHIGSELVIHIPRELRFQQFDHGKREPRRNQRTTALIHVPAIDNRGNNARIRGRAADFLLFQRFHERRFGVTRRRLSFVSVGTNRHRSERIARIHRRQRHIVIRLLIRFDGFAGLRSLFNASSSIALLRFGGRAAALTGRLHKAGELDDSAGSLEYGFPIRFGRCRQSHGRRGTGCVCHLAGKRALPDQRVQLELISRHFACDFRRVAEFRTRRPNAFVGFLRTRGFCGILFRRIRQIVFAEMLDDRFTRSCDRFLRQRHRIGTHVGNIAVFIQSLRRTHGLT